MAIQAQHSVTKIGENEGGSGAFVCDFVVENLRAAMQALNDFRGMVLVDENDEDDDDDDDAEDNDADVSEWIYLHRGILRLLVHTQFYYNIKMTYYTPGQRRRLSFLP